MNKKQITNNNEQITKIEMSKSFSHSSFLIPHFLLLIVLFSFFVISCPDHIDLPEEETTLPKGCGSFTARLTNDPARTIMPSTPQLTDLAVIQLAFTPTSGGQALTDEQTSPASGKLSPVILVAGTYNLTVSAYRDSGKPRLVAKETLNDIVINPGANVNRAINLRAIFSGGTKGTFKWKITLNTESITVNSATMTIKDSGGEPQGAVVNLLSAASTGNRDLDPGLYTVVFNLTDDDYRTVVWNEILHVYSALDSEFEFTFSDEYFTKTHWDVTFERNHLDGGSDSFFQSIMHGKKATKITPDRPGFDFINWYTEPAPFINEWNFDDAVTEDRTLYAKWMARQNVTFEFKITDNTPAVDSNITIYKSNIEGGGPTTAQLMVTDAGSFSNIAWSFNGISLGAGESVTLNSSDNKFNNISGPKFITVEAVKGGIRYSTLVIITVELPAARIGGKTGGKLYGTLSQAISAAPDNGTASLTNPTEIVLLQNITATASFTIPAGKHILLSVDPEYNLTINAAAGSFSLFSNSGGSLILDGSKGSLTLNGGGAAAASDRRGISVTGGTVEVRDNVIVEGFKCSGSGGGVSVTGGTFIMKGGTIYGSDASASQKNEATTSGSSIYVSGGTAKYDGRYGSGTISTNNNTLPALSGTISISRSGTTTYNSLNAVYSGNETVSYQWYRGSTLLDGETKQTCIPTSEASYKVTVSAPGYASKTSGTVSVSLSSFTGTFNITPAGPVTSNTLLTASYTGNEPTINNFTISYQWRKDTSSSSISGATSKTYTPTDAGIYLVTASAAGYANKTSNTAAFITSGTVNTMIEDQWSSDSVLTAAKPQDWYSFNVTAGNTYRVWWNNRVCANGDGTKTADIIVSMINDNGTIIVLEKQYSWTTSTSYTATSDGTVYLQVRPYSTSASYLGTYGVVFSTGTVRPKNNTLDFSVITSTSLTTAWQLGTLGAAATRYWYSFNVTEGHTYYLWWNEKKGSSSLFDSINNTTPADVDVTVWYSNKIEAIPNTDTAWSTPQSFTAAENDTVIVLVRPKSTLSTNYGAFEIVYKDNNDTRPTGEHNTPPSATPLTSGTWANGTITSTNRQVWYSFTVTSGTPYYIWCNDSWSGDKSKTLDVKVSAYYGASGTAIFTGSDIAFGTPQSFTASSSGTVYLMVEPYSSSGGTGTFGIVYSTSNTRPAVPVTP